MVQVLGLVSGLLACSYCDTSPGLELWTQALAHNVLFYIYNFVYFTMSNSISLLDIMQLLLSLLNDHGILSILFRVPNSKSQVQSRSTKCTSPMFNPVNQCSQNQVQTPESRVQSPKCKVKSLKPKAKSKVWVSSPVLVFNYTFDSWI